MKKEHTRKDGGIEELAQDLEEPRALRLLAEWIAIEHNKTRLEAPEYLEEAQSLSDWLYVIGYQPPSTEAWEPHSDANNDKPSPANRDYWHGIIYREVDAAFMTLLGHPMNLSKIREIAVESILGAIGSLIESKVLSEEHKPSTANRECYVTCSRCGMKVSNTVLSSLPEGIVVRAFVECADCVTKSSTADKEEIEKVVLNGETLGQTLFRDVHDIANSYDKDDPLDIEGWVSHIIATLLMYNDKVKPSTATREAMEDDITALIFNWSIQGEKVRPKIDELAKQILSLRLKALSDERIKEKLGEIQPEGFDWIDPTETEMVKFRAISQATVDKDRR